MSDKAASASFDPDTCKNIYTWINHRYQKTKSYSLPGLVPFKLVEILFEEQTQPWKPITEEFVQGVQRVLREAIEYCLMIACKNKRVPGNHERVFDEAVGRENADASGILF
jgi:hypothetical protein